MSLTQSWKGYSWESSRAKRRASVQSLHPMWSWVQCSIRLSSVHQSIVRVPGSTPPATGVRRKQPESAESAPLSRSLNIQVSCPWNGHAYSGHWPVPRCDRQIGTFPRHPDLISHVSIVQSLPPAFCWIDLESVNCSFLAKLYINGMPVLSILPLTPFLLSNNQIVIIVSGSYNGYYFCVWFLLFSMFLAVLWWLLVILFITE